MRILTVSAHYPPNFVSGGTLAPQRLARGLAAQGHEVSVYAGWLGDRAPLETWSDTDETGLAVHWIVTTPWIGWADEHNWLNPAVTDDFRDHVQKHTPDVVHFHSLQSLGAGLLPAAKATGAKVVVTMHDFWWLCSRQFLVDRDDRPCSLVVEAGVCACQVDEPWRRHRGQALDALLQSADLVLAPSASAARVLAANGVAPDRLRVDENGMPAALMDSASPTPTAGPGAPARADDAPIRFLYAGGADPMKGADVLIDAVAALGRAGGRPARRWQLSAYGLGPRLDGRPTDPFAGLPVDVRAPYDPDALGEVLRAHDVLVLASVMRETHSLLTREALAAGLAVVCTDTLGPEEVVADGDNGLIVPAGDAAALAAALTRVVDEPGLAERLRAGAARPLAARSLDDQVTGLEALFTELVRSGPFVASVERDTTRAVRSVVFACGIDGAPLRYRAHLPAEALAGVGVTSRVLHYRHPDLLAAAAAADVVVCYRVPATVQVLETIEALHGAGIPLVFDVDDLIFDPDEADEIPALRLLPADEAALWLNGVERYRTTLEACDAFVGSTALLVERAAAVTGLPAHQFDNGVGFELARAADRELRRPRRPGPLRLGYFSGTTTHDEDWFHIEAAVSEVLARHRDVELWLGGHLPPTPALARFGERIVRVPFVPWLELPAMLRDLDVNLAPLAPGRFNEAKSAIKWLEAALTATPTVASPTEPFRRAIVDPNHRGGRSGSKRASSAAATTGRLATTADEWVAAMSELLDDESTRARVGAAARRQALLEWSPARQGQRYLDILTTVVEAGPRSGRSSSWTPVTTDEPPMVVALEPYGPASEGSRPGGPPAIPGLAALGERWAASRARATDLAHRGAASVRADGVAATAAKVVGRIEGRLQARRYRGRP